MKIVPLIHSLLELADRTELHGWHTAIRTRLRAGNFEGALEACRMAMTADSELISPVGGQRGPEVAAARRNWYNLRQLEARIAEVAAAMAKRTTSETRTSITRDPHVAGLHPPSGNTTAPL